MIKYFLVLLLYVGLTGCASYQYTEIYRDALKTKINITITKEENYQELMKRIAGYFEERGYEKLIYEDSRKGFFVFTKEGDFGEPCKIILKYTQKRGVDKIRIDLVNGSDDLINDSRVSDDIQKIADQINNN